MATRHKSILDPTFKYVPAASTDLRKTFARIRREQAKAQPKPEPSVLMFSKRRKDSID
jgi:hypothetical protein